MLDKRHLTCRLHALTLLDQQMLYNNVRTCSGDLRPNFACIWMFILSSLQPQLIGKYVSGTERKPILNVKNKHFDSLIIIHKFTSGLQVCTMKKLKPYLYSRY